jgi:hypothetical protein
MNPGLVESAPDGPVYGTFRMFNPLKLFVKALRLTTGWDKSEPNTPGGRPPTGPWLVGVICVPNGVVDRAVRPECVGFKPAATPPASPTGPRASSLLGVRVTCANVPNPANALTQTRHLKDFILSPPSISTPSIMTLPGPSFSSPWFRYFACKCCSAPAAKIRRSRHGTWTNAYPPRPINESLARNHLVRSNRDYSRDYVGLQQDQQADEYRQGDAVEKYEPQHGSRAYGLVLGTL